MPKPHAATRAAHAATRTGPPPAIRPGPARGAMDRAHAMARCRSIRGSRVHQPSTSDASNSAAAGRGGTRLLAAICQTTGPERDGEHERRSIRAHGGRSGPISCMSPL